MSSADEYKGAETFERIDLGFERINEIAGEHEAEQKKAFDGILLRLKELGDEFDKARKWAFIKGMGVGCLFWPVFWTILYLIVHATGGES